MGSRSFLVLITLFALGLGVFMAVNYGKNSLSVPGMVSNLLPSNGNTLPTNVPVSLEKGMTLTLSSPQTGSTVSSSLVLVSGKTGANAEVFVNDGQTKADAAGNFSLKLNLDEGENTISVSTNDADGNYAEKEINVTYNP